MVEACEKGRVKTLQQQRLGTGDIGHRHGYSRRKARVLPEYRGRLGELVDARPDRPWPRSKADLAMPCTVTAVHHALGALAGR